MKSLLPSIISDNVYQTMSGVIPKMRKHLNSSAAYTEKKITTKNQSTHVLNQFI